MIQISIQKHRFLRITIEIYKVSVYEIQLNVPLPVEIEVEAVEGKASRDEGNADEGGDSGKSSTYC